MNTYIYIQKYISIHIYTYIPIGESPLSDKVEGSNGAEERSKRSVIRKSQFTNLDMALRWVKNSFTKQISVRTDGSSRRSSLRPKMTSRSCKQRGVLSASRCGIYYHPQYGKLMLLTLDHKEIVKDFQSSFSFCRLYLFIYIHTYTHTYVYLCKYICVYVCIHINIYMYICIYI